LCEEEEGKALVRRLVAVQRVVLDPEARLIPDINPSKSKWRTDMRLTGAVFSPRLNANKGNKQVLDTIFELLKLAGRQCNKGFLRECEQKAIYDMERQGGWCTHRFPYHQYQLQVEMTKKGWELFEKRVCRVLFNNRYTDLITCFLYSSLRTP
jgi:hypothetical protein